MNSARTVVAAAGRGGGASAHAPPPLHAPPMNIEIREIGSGDFPFSSLSPEMVFRRQCFISSSPLFGSVIFLFLHPLPPCFRWLDCRGGWAAVVATEVVGLEEVVSGQR